MRACRPQADNARQNAQPPRQGFIVCSGARRFGLSRRPPKVGRRSLPVLLPVGALRPRARPRAFVARVSFGRPRSFGLVRSAPPY